MLGCIWNHFLLQETRCKTGRTGTINAKVRATKLHRNFCNKRTRSTLLDPKLMFCSFHSFWCIWDHFVTAWNSVQNRMNWCNYSKSLCHEVASEFFATSTPDPTHRTLNSCFGAFQVHLGLFCYCMKLDAKCAKLVQLMQKFMPWSHIRIIHKECTWSTPMDPKLMFCCISQCLGAFGAISLLHETRCKMA